ncbi:MAG: class I SAM-dependent methyltransferase [Proteobacteria bacterium]|nr:MAG: class I SAM-dependent methyltransferase [Pseudomonadota bacterium]
MPKSEATPRAYLPAAGHDWLLRFYDPVSRLTGAGALHAALVAQAALAPGHAVLDVGAGTGTLAVRIAREHPGVDVTALDPDPKALAIARRKAERAGVAVRFERGYGDALPFADARFDRVLSSLMFHHLDGETKRGMLRDVRRVLRPGGGLHLADFARGHARPRGFLARLFHHAHALPSSDDATIESLLAESGFAEIALAGEHHTLFGRIARYRAIRPDAA